MINRLHLLYIIVILLLPNLAHPLSIQAVALFSERAMLVIDGERTMLSVGEISPHGVALVHADSDTAIIRYQGREQKLALGGHISSDFVAAKPKRYDKTVSIKADPQGMYRKTGTINGHKVYFLVDTGATVIAMSSAMAKRIGLKNYRHEDNKTMSETASGVVPVYMVTLRKVTLGDIEVRNVSAAIMEGELPSSPLLGMSFLRQLQMERSTNVLTLIQK